MDYKLAAEASQTAQQVRGICNPMQARASDDEDDEPSVEQSVPPASQPLPPSSGSSAALSSRLTALKARLEAERKRATAAGGQGCGTGTA